MHEKEMELREAIELAKSKLGNTPREKEAAFVLQLLLDQKNENGVPLLDECRLAIFG